MTSKMQVVANRANAKKSTGPKTLEGQTTSCQNAMKHGLRTRDLLIRDEKQEDLEQFRQMVYQALCPQDAVEELLVEKIINTTWRMRRLTQAEGELFDYEGSYYKNSLKQAFCGNSGTSLQILSRYETALERSFYKAMHELQRVQGMRLGQPVLAPMAIDISSDAAGEIGFVS